MSTEHASKLEPEDEGGVDLEPEIEEDFDAMIAETDRDEAAGRGMPWAEFRKELRRLTTG